MRTEALIPQNLLNKQLSRRSALGLGVAAAVTVACGGGTEVGKRPSSDNQLVTPDNRTPNPNLSPASSFPTVLSSDTPLPSATNPESDKESTAFPTAPETATRPETTPTSPESTPTPTEVVDTEKLVEWKSQLGFKIKYPQGWFRRNSTDREDFYDNTDGGGRIVINAYEKGYGSHEDWQSLEEYGNDLFNRAIKNEKEYPKQSSEQFSDPNLNLTSGPGSNMDGVKTFQISGEVDLFILLNGISTEDISLEKSFALFFLTDRHSWQIYFSAKKEAFENYLPMFQEMLDSFQFISDEEKNQVEWTAYKSRGEDPSIPNFQIDYPENWGEGQEEEGYISFKKERVRNNDTSVEVKVDPSYTYTNPDNYEEYVSLELSSSGIDFSVEKDQVINGVPSIIFNWTSAKEEDGGERKHSLVFQVANNTGLQFHYIADSLVFDQSLETFQKMVESFRFSS